MKSRSRISCRPGGFDLLGVANVRPSIDDSLRRLPGYAELFGNQDFCHCEHCQSVLGPAAYFVDLMVFVEQHDTKDFFSPAASAIRC